MGFLDDLLPVRRILIDGVEQEFRRDLNFVGAQIEDDPQALALRLKFGLRVAGFASGATLQADYLCLLEDNEDLTPSFVLPAPATWSGQRIVVKRLDQAAASVELSVAGGANIDGAATYTLVGTDVAAEFWSDGISVYVGPNDVGGGGGPALSGAAPQSVGLLASAGVSVDASRADHVHPHGNLSASGAFHAAATTSINGFMSSADKTKLDASTAAATANALCQRDASGFLAVSRLTTPDLRAPTSLDISGAPINLAAATIGIADALGGNQIAVCSVGAATRVEIQDFCTSFELRWAASAAGVGADTIVQSQAGASGSRNGFLRLRNPSGNTVLGGGVLVDVGSVVSNVSDPFAVEANGSRILSVLQNAASSTLIRNASDSNTIVIGGSSGGASNSLSIIPNAATTLVGSAGYLLLSSNTAQFYTQSSTGIQIFNGVATKAWLYIPSTTVISTATTSTLLSWTTTSNRVYTVESVITASNDTDNQGASYVVRAAFKNVGGTITQIGTTAVTVVGEDAGQTGLDATIDFSGTAIRIRFVTDAADTVTVESMTNVYVCVLT